MRDSIGASGISLGVSDRSLPHATGRRGPGEGGPTGVNGVLLKIALLFPPANSVFTPEELERRLEQLSEEKLSRETRIREETLAGRRTQRVGAPSGSRRPQVKHLPADWIVVNCCDCRRVLLTSAMKTRVSVPWVLKRGLEFVASKTEDGYSRCPDCTTEASQAKTRVAS